MREAAAIAAKRARQRRRPPSAPRPTELAEARAERGRQRWREGEIEERIALLTRQSGDDRGRACQARGRERRRNQACGAQCRSCRAVGLGRDRSKPSLLRPRPARKWPRRARQSPEPRPRRPSCTSQELETELATLLKLLAPAEAATGRRSSRRSSIASGYEQALGAALGDDLDAASDEAAPSHWRLVAGEGDPELPEGAVAAQQIRQRPAGARAQARPRSAWSRPHAGHELRRQGSSRARGSCPRKAISGAGTATASRPARRARPARASSSAAGLRR